MSKKVTLKELTLRNFKGIRDLAVKFGEVTTIAGANATGKSTVFDAFTPGFFSAKTVTTVRIAGKAHLPLRRSARTGTLYLNWNIP